MRNIKPTMDRILVEIIQEEYKGMIHLTDTAKKSMLPQIVKCKAIAVGDGHYNSKGVFIPQEIKVGQTIYVNKAHLHRANLDEGDIWMTTRGYVEAVED